MDKQLDIRKDWGFLKWFLIVISFIFLSVFLILPLIYIVATAFRDGIEGYIRGITDEYAIKDRYEDVCVCTEE